MFKSYSILLKIILLGSFISGLLIAGFGVILIYLGATGESEFKFFGQEFKSTNVGLAAIFIGGSLIVLLVKRSLKSLDSAIKSNSGNEDNNKHPRRENSEKAIEKILDIFSTHRAFFKGDEQILADCQKNGISNAGLWKQLGYLDAGRAIAVAGSFASIIKNLQKELSKLETISNQRLKENLSNLIVACKDYNDKYGHKDSAGLSLPHIGWGQRLRDFYVQTNHFNFSSNDSIKTYKELLVYLSDSCNDLIVIRKIAFEIIEIIENHKKSLKERSVNIKSMILDGINSLKQIIDIFEQVIFIIEEINENTEQFEERKKLLKEKANLTDGTVSHLLLAISNVKSSEAWQITTNKTILTKIEYVKEYRVKVYFSDGKFFDFELGNEIWENFHGFSMNIETFKSFFIDFDQNEIRWKKEIRARITGEGLRRMLESEKKD